MGTVLGNGRIFSPCLRVGELRTENELLAEVQILLYHHLQEALPGLSGYLFSQNLVLQLQTTGLVLGSVNVERLDDSSASCDECRKEA